MTEIGMVNIPALPELEFEERSHAYRLNGTVLPSVSKVMEPMSAAYYGGINKATLDRAAARGTAVHHAIENHLEFGIDDISPEHEGYYAAFKSWWGVKQPKLIATERRVYHKHLRYAGTADLSCIMDDAGTSGLSFLVDFKTTAQIVEMLVRVQLEAYWRAFCDHGALFDRKAAVHLKPDGTWSMNVFMARDMEAWNVFGSLLMIQNYLTKYRR